MSGEAIYRGYDRAALDAQYNNRARIPEYVDHFERWLAWSAETRAALSGARDVAYGALPVETLDIFPAEEPDAPILIMIHGGYWYSLDKHHDSFVAEGCRPYGVATVVINYGLAPDYRMDEIVRQNRAAGAWVWRNAASFGGDPSRIHALGQSAGGHLAAMLLATDWPAFGADLPADLVKSAVSISGIYDLEPIRLCYLNDKVGMDEAEARRNSPVEQRYPVAVPISSRKSTSARPRPWLRCGRRTAARSAGWNSQATTTSPWPTSFASRRASSPGRQWRRWESLSDPHALSSIVSTAAPWSRPERRRSSPVLASASGMGSTCIAISVRAASAKNSSPSRRVRLATETMRRSRHSSS